MATIHVGDLATRLVIAPEQPDPANPAEQIPLDPSLAAVQQIKVVDHSTGVVTTLVPAIINEGGVNKLEAYTDAGSSLWTTAGKWEMYAFLGEVDRGAGIPKWSGHTLGYVFTVAPPGS